MLLFDSHHIMFHLISHHPVYKKENNSSNNSERHWRLLIYALHNFYHIIKLNVSRSNHHCSCKLCRKTTVLETLLFHEMMKLYKNICSTQIKVDFHSVNVSCTNDTIDWWIFFVNLHLQQTKCSVYLKYLFLLTRSQRLK